MNQSERISAILKIERVKADNGIVRALESGEAEQYSLFEIEKEVGIISHKDLSELEYRGYFTDDFREVINFFERNKRFIKVKDKGDIIYSIVDIMVEPLTHIIVFKLEMIK